MQKCVDKVFIEKNLQYGEDHLNQVRAMLVLPRSLELNHLKMPNICFQNELSIHLPCVNFISKTTQKKHVAYSLLINHFTDLMDQKTYYAHFINTPGLPIGKDMLTDDTLIVFLCSLYLLSTAEVSSLLKRNISQ